MLEANPKKVLVETWGCQMNVADSEKMLGQLQDKNYVLTDDENEADLFLLNTCHIREKATHKVLSRLGRLREVQAKKPGSHVIVAGCVAQAEGKKLLKKAANIDMLIGPGKIDELGNVIDRFNDSGSRQLETGFLSAEKNREKATDLSVNPTLTGKSEISRFINIAQGCDNFCTFCVVPFTRGREISKSPEDIYKEAQNMVASGAKEITLLGQNVNSYGTDLIRDGVIPQTEVGPFVDLLRNVAEIEGLKRLRFTTSNPHDFTEPLADLFRTHGALGKYIHLPVQSGNNTVLERMKRKVTREEYFERIGWLRAIDPEMAISTDLIVGFPGETEEQFEETLDLVEKIRYSFIYCFKYSPRKNTAAARFKDQIDDKVMSVRLARLNELQDKITVELNQSEISKEREILCHYKSKKEDDVYYGRTPQFRLVRIKSQRDLVGRTVQAKIIQANKTALVGELLI